MAHPAGATATHCLLLYSKIEIGLTFLVLAHPELVSWLVFSVPFQHKYGYIRGEADPGSSGQRAVKWGQLNGCCCSSSQVWGIGVGGVYVLFANDLTLELIESLDSDCMDLMMTFRLR